MGETTTLYMTFDQKKVTNENREKAPNLDFIPYRK